MLYECLVIDNSNFFKDGTIRVRIKKEVSSSTMMRDLSINPKQSINEYGNQRFEKYGNETEFKYDDRDVRLSTNIGGAYDYGLFILPQPNSWGLVAELRNYDINSAEPRYVWVGALSMFNYQKKDVDIPSDNLEKLNGCNNGEINLEKPYSGLVFKQKETHISESSKNIDENATNNLNWKLRPTQNMVVFNENKVFIIHNNFNEDGVKIGESSLTLNKEGAQINYTDNETGNNSKLILNNNGTFDLESVNSEENVINSVNSTKNSLYVEHSDKDSSASISMGNDNFGKPNMSLNFSEGKELPTSIIMDSRSGMTINSNKNISINPGPNGDVTLGTGEGYILTSASPGTFNLDNNTFTAVKTAKA